MARQRSSWGCVQRLASGRYRLRWVEGGKRRTEIVWGTRREADDRLAAIRVEVGSERTRRVTMRQAHDAWYLPTLEDLAPATVKRRECVWRAHVEPMWGGRDLASIQPLEIQEWLMTMTEAIARNSLTVCRDCAGAATVYGGLRSNPFAADYRMPRSSRRVDGATWTLDGLREVWRCVAGTPVEAAVLLMAFGSARVGESLGARCAEVYTRESHGVTLAMVPIERQVMNDGGMSESLKNRWSRRTLAVPGRMGERLLAIAAAGGEWMSESLGSWLSQKQLRTAWAELVPPGLRHPMKNLRASWQTYMRWELKVSPEHIEKMMGHVGAGVTGRHYDKPDAEVFAEVVGAAYAARPFAEEWDT